MEIKFKAVPDSMRIVVCLQILKNIIIQRERMFIMVKYLYRLLRQQNKTESVKGGIANEML